MSGYALRGIIEGFYGPPWSDADRRFALDRAGELGLNLYVHAPKDDPHHRARWRDPLEPAQERSFASLIEYGAARGVRVGFALAPGVDIAYADAEDRRCLQARFGRLAELGARFLVLALDDVPSHFVHARDAEAYDSLASAHVACLEAAREAAPADSEWAFIPIDYLGSEASDYLETLGAQLPAEVHIGWTGPTVLSPEIPADAARARARTLRRKLLLWDNVPAADGPMRRMLHLGPYRGRDVALPDSVHGVLLNPMQHARASFVTIAAAAPLLRDPAHDPEAAWEDAVRRVAGDDPELASAFRCFAMAHRFAPQSQQDRDPELEALWLSLRDALRANRRDEAALEAVEAAVEARVRASAIVRERLPDRALVREIDPWLDSHAAESADLARAMRVVRALWSDVSAAERVRAVMVCQGGLTLAAPPLATSYGPRRVLYPQLSSMRDETMAFTGPEVLLRDRCLSDEIVRCVEQWAVESLSNRGMVVR